MELKVQCFGPSRDVFGGTMVRVEVDEGSSVAVLVAALSETSSEAAELLTHCAVAVGDEIVPRTHLLFAQDSVALLPPVNGG